MSVVRNIVIFIVSILTIAFLVCADVLALVVYPFWVWKHPSEASELNSLVELIGWRWLEDIVNPREYCVSNMQLKFFQAIMRRLDSRVVTIWNAWFMNFAPMTKRKYFIDMLGNGLQALSPKVQKEYFKAVESERKVYLIKNNMLSPEILPELYKLSVGPFVEAGKISDDQFRDLTSGYVAKFSEKYDLSLGKQIYLISQSLKQTACLSVLSDYILRKGLHPSAVSYLYRCAGKGGEDAGLQKILDALEERQDLVTILQTSQKADISSYDSYSLLGMLDSYLEERKKLGYNAQLAMSSAQYEIFHKRGMKMHPKVIYEKLARVNKNADATKFVERMMKYNEFAGDEIAMHQIAGDEKLSQLWLQHYVNKS